MKKLLTSASLFAVGAAALQAQYAPEPGLSSTQTSKPWSVSATLRGFYDDNYSTLPDNPVTPGYPAARDSFGFEVSPSIGVNFTLPQTYIGLNYTYGLRYYDDRVSDSADHSHQANLKISHAFTEQYKLDLSNSFVVAQEPELINPASGPFALPLRADGSNIRNTASIKFTADITEQMGLGLGYDNNYFDYDQDGPGSYSALLDRTEHTGTVDLRWRVRPTTVASLGYKYGITDYNSDELISATPGTVVTSSYRDADSHTVFLGIEEAINPQLNGALRVGAQFTQYDNAAGASPDDSVNPYVDASLTYNYTTGSYAQLGVMHRRTATDIIGSLTVGGAPDIAMDQESTTVYGSISHKIGDLTVGLTGHYQNSSWEGGSVDGLTEDFWGVGLNLSYQINTFLSAEVGYNHDDLSSDVTDRGYDRNRVYIGLRASY